MRKIPVWRTIGSAYGFAFEHLATIIGLIWLPLGLMFAAEYFAISRYLDGVSTALASGNRFAVYAGAGYLYLYRLAALLLQAIIAAPLMRQALGLRNKATFVHFGLGLTELRMFGAFVACYLIVATIEIAGLVVYFLLVLAMGLAARAIGDVQGVPASVVAVWTVVGLLTVLAAALVFITVRLSFLLAAVVVSENRIDLIRAWTLTEGNFWRIFWVLVFVTVPAWILYLAIQMAFFGFAAYGEATNIVPTANQFAGNIHVAALQMHRLLAWLPYVYGAWFLVQPLALGLGSGAAAAAYRALVPPPPAVSTPPADSAMSVAVA